MKRPIIIKIAIALVIIVFLLVFINMTGSKRTEVSAPEVFLRESLGAMQSGLVKASTGIREGIHQVFFSESAEIDQLEQRIRELEGELVVFQEYKLQNHRLQELLDYQEEQEQHQMIAARVIARDPGNWFERIKVDRGQQDGLRRDQAVVLPEGLVGRIVAVTPNTAEVMLITDPQSGVASLIQDTRTPGVVQGALNRTRPLRMSYITKETEVQAGHWVITSGQGVFPGGIPIGRIIEVHKDFAGLTLTADVEPMVHFDYLEEVLVIIDTQSGG